MEFVEAPAFARNLPRYLPDDEYRAFQTELAENPLLGDVIPGTGGFRKLHWADRRRGKGRRGGLRLIYFCFESEQQIWLMTFYSKDEAEDMSEAEKRQLKSAISAELKMRSERRKGKRGRNEQ